MTSMADATDPTDFKMVRTYPARGDGAIAELRVGDHEWAQIELRGIQVDQLGDDRVRGAWPVLLLFPPPEVSGKKWWEFDLDAVREQFDLAEKWLLENERERPPITG